MYKEFSKWFEDNFVVIQQQNPGADCEACNDNCNICRHNLVELESEEEFELRMEQYMIGKIQLGTLDPTNILDAYMSTLYVRFLVDQGILDFGGSK